MTDRDVRADRRRLGEGAIVVALLVVAALARRGSLPTDGLWYDDAWVAAGASKGRASQLLLVSTNHPGFSAVLMVWARVVDHRSELLALPAFVAGTIAPALAYLVLRAKGVLVGVALAVASLLLVSQAHVRYSGRVKPYVLETAVVLGLALVVPWLARRRWGWGEAAAWAIGAVLLGTASAFTAVAVGVAGLVLVLHPAGDRVRRVVAVAVQAAVQGALLVAVQARFDSAQVADDWEEVYDGFIELHANPFRVLGQLASHTGELGKALVDGPRALGFVIVAAAVAGLAWRARSGPHVVVSRFLLALPAVALVGSLLRQIPYGAVENGVSPGSRTALWLLPSLVVGLAFLVDGAIRRLRPDGGWTPAVTAAGVACALVMAATGVGDAPDYPLEGDRRATAYVRTRLRPGTAVLVMPTGAYPFAAEPGIAVRLVADRKNLIGYDPVPLDERVLVTRGTMQGPGAGEVRAFVASADRVLVHDGLVGLFDPITEVEQVLRDAGFRRTASESFGKAAVVVFARDDG